MLERLAGSRFYGIRATGRPVNSRVEPGEWQDKTAGSQNLVRRFSLQKQNNSGIFRGFLDDILTWEYSN
jgi:hypothetical protein